MGERIGICAVSLTDLEGWFAARQEPAYRARQVLDWVYRKRINTVEGMTNLPLTVRQKLAESFSMRTLEPARVVGSADTTRKLLFRLSDGALIETVLIPANPALYGSKSDRRTLCVSTQVGCAYGCRFCASGLAGWTRNLRAAEIVEQILRSRNPREQKALGRKVSNFDATTWNRVCRGIVYRGNLAKYKQNAPLRELLLATGEKPIVEASPTDRIWGIGLSVDDGRAHDPARWRGTNWLGIALTQVREALKPRERDEPDPLPDRELSQQLKDRWTLRNW